MKALLGKITNVTATDSATRLDVSFTPVCVLPGRSDVPEWLAGQTLTIGREVTDPREVGDVGDSIVLTPAESTVWLTPLRVEPPIAWSEVPETVRVKLLWWRDETPGEVVVAANGRQRTFAFGPADANGPFAVDVPTAAFFDHAPSLPADLIASFGKLTVGCAVLPTDDCCHRKLHTDRGERHLVRSRWYDVRICAERAGGGICGLREIGRQVDHFQSDDNMIGEVFAYGGHVDLVRLGWYEKMRDTAMRCVAVRRDAEACRVHLEGEIETDRAHTAVTTTVFDELPLVLMQRDVVLKKPAKKDDDGDPKASVPIDDVVMLTLGFHAVYRVEPHRPCDSRALSVDAGRLAAVRLCETGDHLHGDWRPSDGWLLIEHPQRRECSLYLFARDNPPELQCWLGDRMMAVEPQWPGRPVRPDQGAGFTLALTAGEVCGASVGGAWVACRRPLAGGGVACAMVGRFVEPPARRAAFGLGGHDVSAKWERTMLPGVGTVYVASAVVAASQMTDTFTATPGDAPARSET